MKFHNLFSHLLSVVDFSGMKGRIQSVSAGRIMVDFNNPLAGKKLSYELEVKEKIDAPEEQIKAVFEFFGIEKVGVKLEDTIVNLETGSLPAEVKSKVSSMLMEYVKSQNKAIEKVRFIETYEKKNAEEKK